MYESKLSPPVPVAVGSPVWAIKSFDTVNVSAGSSGSQLTIEKGVERVVFHFTQLEKVLTCPGTQVDLEVDDNVAEGRLEEDGHDEGECVVDENKMLFRIR
jgi:hypothetical protein